MLNSNATPFVPTCDRSVYELHSSGWFDAHNIPRGLVNTAMKGARKVWHAFGPWREAHLVTLQELYNAFRLDSGLFATLKLDELFAFPGIHYYLREVNDDEEWYMQDLDDD